jgi:hypothetical protein
MRRHQQAVPLTLGGSAGGERKKPWWFDDRTPHQAKEAEPKDTKDQGVSLSFLLHSPRADHSPCKTSFVRRNA